MNIKADANYSGAILRKFISKAIVITALLLTMSMLLLSCGKPAEESFPQASEALPTIQDDYYDSLERGPSGPLRLFWTNRSSLNPVLDQTYTGKAAYKLVYRSLLAKNEDGSLTYDLAERIIWTEDGLNLIIMVQEDQYYHDGSKLQASDAALALSYLWSQHGGPAFSPDRFQIGDQAGAEDQPGDLEQNETEPTGALDDQTNDIDDEDNETSDNDQDDLDILNDYPKTRSTAEIFSLLQEIKIIDEKSFKCVFSEPVIEFVSLLDYAIIPSSSWQSDDPWQIIPGNGRYRISSYDENGDITLVPSKNSDTGPEEIVLKQYFDEADAMRALEEDALDVVLLMPNSYALYHTRNNLELIRFTGASSVFLTANTDEGIVSDPEVLLDIKRILQSSNLRSYYSTWPGELADYPLPASSYMIEHDLTDLSKLIGQPETIESQLNVDPPNTEVQTSETVNSSDDSDIESTLDSESTIIDSRKQVKIIAPYQDHLIAAAGIIQDVLNGYYRAELEMLAQDDYITALQNKEYDLALCQSNLPAAEDPSWLYGPNGSVSGMESISMGGINNYAQKRVELFNFHEIWYKPNETDRIDFTDKKNSFSELIIRTAADSPYIHLYLPYAALAYGDRVKGQSNPNKYDPYKGIEELWIWSGQ